MKGFIYLMQAAGGMFKIGKSISPKKRVTKFGSLPWDIRLAHVIETDDMDWLESKMHGVFSQQKVRGEWFRLSAEDVEWFTGIAVLDRESPTVLVSERMYCI